MHSWPSLTLILGTEELYLVNVKKKKKEKPFEFSPPKKKVESNPEKEIKHRNLIHLENFQTAGKGKEKKR